MRVLALSVFVWREAMVAHPPPSIKTAAIAFSSEVDTGSRQENA